MSFKIKYGRLGEDNEVQEASVFEAFSEDQEQRRLIKQEVFGNFWISTVFLRMDHSFTDEPLWFETMIFPAENGERPAKLNEEWCERCSTYEQALAMHQRAIDAVNNGELDVPDLVD